MKTGTNPGGESQGAGEPPSPATGGRLQLYREYPPPDEPELIERILALDAAFLKSEYPPPARALRSAHPKAHGVVRAELTVLPGLPADLRVGLFSAPGTYQAWIRFSNASAVRPDIGPDARGMAIKVMGVPGPKLLEEERDALTQDFLLLSGLPFFLSGTAADFVRFLTDKAKFTRESGADKMSGLDETSLLDIRYYSTTPYRFGEKAVQYQVVPLAPLVRARPEAPDFNFLRRRMEEDLLVREVVLDFLVQFQVDAEKQPIENARVPWSEELSAPVKVASIRIPRQIFNTSEQDDYGDGLSFNPWHSLPAHQPIGGVNRARKAAYRRLARLRLAANGAPLAEPSSFADFDAPHVAPALAEARYALADAVARYAAIADAGDAEAYGACFLPEGSLIVYTARTEAAPAVRLMGRDDLLAGMKRILEAWSAKNLKVLLSAPLVDEISADRARTRTMFVAYAWDEAAAAGGAKISISSWYHDTWVRTPEGWRLERRIEHPAAVLAEVPGLLDSLAAIERRVADGAKHP